MKKILLLATAIVLCLNVFAQKSVQSIKYEGALAQAISQERFTLLQTESPSKLVATYYETTQFCYIANSLPVNVRVMGELCDFVCTGETCDDASSVIAIKQINRHKYMLEQDEIRYTAYAIGSTGYYAIVYPTGEYLKNYASFMKEYGF